MLISDFMIRQAETCIQLLLKDNLKISFAESCTGGLLSLIFSCVPGASRVMHSSFVTYSNRSKMYFLGVQSSAIEKYGVVSKEIACMMTEGLLSHIPDIDIAISTTGIAGLRTSSNGNDYNEEKVGNVFIGLARRGGVAKASEYNFGNILRHEIQQKTAMMAIKTLLVTD